MSRTLLFVLVQLPAAMAEDPPPVKVPCHSGQENDIEFAACNDYCTEARHC